MLLFAAGSTETPLARDIQSHLTFTDTTSGTLMPAFDDPAGYRVVRFIDNTTTPVAGSANLTYTDGDSLIFVSLSRTTPTDPDVLLSPSIIDAPEVGIRSMCVIQVEDVTGPDPA